MLRTPAFRPPESLRKAPRPSPHNKTHRPARQCRWTWPCSGGEDTQRIAIESLLLVQLCEVSGWRQWPPLPHNDPRLQVTANHEKESHTQKKPIPPVIRCGRPLNRAYNTYTVTDKCVRLTNISKPPRSPWRQRRPGNHISIVTPLLCDGIPRNPTSLLRALVPRESVCGAPRPERRRAQTCLVAHRPTERTSLASAPRDDAGPHRDLRTAR